MIRRFREWFSDFPEPFNWICPVMMFVIFFGSWHYLMSRSSRRKKIEKDIQVEKDIQGDGFVIRRGDDQEDN